ncbi:MAG: SDR family NAD(P)-dependent oxidoreductase [Anaerolineales bacterium]|nr:SDR family NAD(P)-dependent oxidoreductase [Anaerolineales bacterium]
MSSLLANRHVFVTGAGGFIGSHLVERLVVEGARVRAFVRYTARSDIGYLRLVPPDVLAQIEFVFGDLRDEHAVAEAMRDVDVVFHLGALIAIPYSYVHPREVVETNVIGTLNVLMAAHQHRTRRVIHTSTSEVYGTALRVPIDEEHPLQGQSPYSASKIGADKLVESFVRSFQVPAVTVRPFNTYGPRQSARAVIPTIISQALVRDGVYLGDLTPTRDLTYVSDTVDGFVRGATAEGVIGETFNLGSDCEISIGDLAHLIIQLVGRPLKVKTDLARIRPSASEVRRLRADNRKAKARLGWQPRISLEEGLRQTIEWVRAHPEFFDPERYAI